MVSDVMHQPQLAGTLTALFGTTKSLFFPSSTELLSDLYVPRRTSGFLVCLSLTAASMRLNIHPVKERLINLFYRKCFVVHLPS